MSLNTNQKKFCDYYIKFGNVAKASELAGYNKNSGYKLMKLPQIKDYIELRLQEVSSDSIADVSEIMKYLTKFMRGDDEQKITIRERLKAAELLGKTYSIFSSKPDENNLHTTIIFGEDDILE